jgi:hypothetical protein
VRSGYEGAVRAVETNGPRHGVAVANSLLADWVKQPDGIWRVGYDFVLNPASALTLSVCATA